MYEDWSSFKEEESAALLAGICKLWGGGQQMPPTMAMEYIDIVLMIPYITLINLYIHFFAFTHIKFESKIYLYIWSKITAIEKSFIVT